MFALSVPAQVDGVRMHEDVHEVVDDLALDVVLNTVHQKPTTHVYHLNEGQISGKNKWMLRLGKPSVLVVPAKPWNTIDNYISVWNLSHIFCPTDDSESKQLSFTYKCLKSSIFCLFIRIRERERNGHLLTKHMYICLYVQFFLLSYLSYSSGSSGW